jgi:hypothetical protein
MKRGRLKLTSVSSRKALYADTVPSNVKRHSMNRVAIIREFFEFLRERKKWWIAPILIFLVLLGVLVIFASSSTLAPFIYSLF